MTPLIKHCASAAAIIAGAAGGGVAIALMQYVSDRTTFPLMLIPFATSIVLVMGSPAAEPAQPRPLVCGHLLATLVGIVVVKLVGPSAWAAAVAVGMAMIVMHFARSFHPPAGIDPLIVVHNDLSWSFLVIPVGAGALLLAAFAFTWHNLLRRDGWPMRWR